MSLEDSIPNDQGFVRSVLGTDPAAGAEVSETVPTNARWKLHSIIASLVTDGTVANRNVNWIIDDGTTTLYTSNDNTNHAATTTASHILSENQTRGTIGTIYNSPMNPVGLVLFQGWRIRTSTTNLQAGDNWAAPQIFVEEWIEE